MKKPVSVDYQTELSAKETARARDSGVIVVVHPKGELADTFGAYLTRAVVARPGETSADCLARLGIVRDPNDTLVDFALDATCAP